MACESVVEEDTAQQEGVDPPRSATGVPERPPDREQSQGRSEQQKSGGGSRSSTIQGAAELHPTSGTGEARQAPPVGASNGDPERIVLNALHGMSDWEHAIGTSLYDIFIRKLKVNGKSVQSGLAVKVIGLLVETGIFTFLTMDFFDQKNMIKDKVQYLYTKFGNTRGTIGICIDYDQAAEEVKNVTADIINGMANDFTDDSGVSEDEDYDEDEENSTDNEADAERERLIGRGTKPTVFVAKM